MGAMSRRRARGDTLLITLVALLILSLGFLYSMRGALVDTMITGNNVARQRDAQIADIALRQLETTIVATYNDQPLEVSASGQTWYRNVSGGTAPPTGSYWTGCYGASSSASRCGAISLTGVPGVPANYTAYAVVQPTGRSDAYACGTSQYRALYYEIFIFVFEGSAGASITPVTSSTSETVYRLCTLS